MRTVKRAIIIAIALLWAASGAHAQTVRMSAAVEKDTVFVGEQFTFQLQIEGDDQPPMPAMPQVDGLMIEDVGGQPSSSQSVTIINGQMQRQVRKSYIHVYRVTAQRPGAFLIPAIELTIQGQVCRTQPIRITAQKPQETEDFKFRLELSKAQCYTGEPLVFTATWYISKSARNVNILIPVLESPDFQAIDLQPTSTGNDLAEIPVNGKPCVAKQAKGTLDGRAYTTITFSKALIPRKAGVFDFPEATAACEAAIGQDTRRRSGPFGDPFFDGFMGGAQTRYGGVVTASNPLHLEVKDVPSQGRPASFNGLIGAYSIEATATPTEVNVGDPITLTVKVRGGQYPDAAQLPPLESQPALAKDFKIPKEMAPGKVDNGVKVFTQTIRAENAQITQVPPIELSFFDTDAGQYRTAQTAPIPLKVHETTVVTSASAEGVTTPAERNEITERRDGIAHNYEGPAVLVNQAYGLGAWMSSPLRAGILIFPPLGYAALLVGLFVYRRQGANPAQRRKRKAHSTLCQTLDQLSTAGNAQAGTQALDAFRAYLGAKLGLTAGALTYGDVRGPLIACNVTPQTLAAIQGLFEEGMACQYAGAQTSSDMVSRIIGQARELGAALEKELRT